MDGIANIAKQQVQTQVNPHQESQIQSHEANKTQESSNDVIEQSNKKLLNSEKDVQKLVEDLNKEISVLNTSLKFGVDKSDMFFVSVIDKKTDKMIRRWPAEEANTLLPKVREFTGLLFDTKG